jgi:hypothetical protein
MTDRVSTMHVRQRIGDMGGDKGLNEDGSFKELLVHVGTVCYVDFTTGSRPRNVDRILLNSRP